MPRATRGRGAASRNAVGGAAAAGAAAAGAATEARVEPRIADGPAVTAAPASGAATSAPASGAVADVRDRHTAAQVVAAEMKALGSEHLFLMTGRDNTLWIALQQEGIRQNLARSEAGAVYMADGYARLTGRPTFVYGGYGPGAANVAASLAEPFWSASPVVALCSAMRRTERFRSEYQELDQLHLFSGVTKWGGEIAHAPQVPRYIREAARQSLIGRPGPVYLGVPSDVFEDELPGYATPPVRDTPLQLPLTRPAASTAELEAVMAALRDASRPVLLAGSGIHHSNAHDALRQVAEHFGLPVVTSVAGKGSIAESHALSMGTVGRYSRNYANATLREADVVLAVGTHLAGMVTDSYKLIGKDTRIIHVTVDEQAIGQNFPTEIGLVADASNFLSGLLEAAGRRQGSAAAREEGTTARAEQSDGGGAGRARYLQDLTSRRRSWEERRAELASHDGEDGRPMRPEALLLALTDDIADDAVITADTGYASAWAGGILELQAAGRRFMRADGSLSWAFPGALGAQLAVPDQHVVCIIGDGGFGYHVGEIETALRLNLPITVVILNNGTLAFEAHVQTLLYDHLVAEVDDFVDVDYAAVARAFGAEGHRVRSVSEFRTALEAGGRREKITIIDAIIDRHAIPPVTRYDRVRTREL